MAIVTSELAVNRSVGFSSLPEYQLYRSVADLAASETVVAVGFDRAGAVELELGGLAGGTLEGEVGVDFELSEDAFCVELFEVEFKLEVSGPVVAEVKLEFVNFDVVTESDTERPLDAWGVIGLGTFDTTP